MVFEVKFQDAREASVKKGKNRRKTSIWGKKTQKDERKHQKYYNALYIDQIFSNISSVNLDNIQNLSK